MAEMTARVEVGDAALGHLHVVDLAEARRWFLTSWSPRAEHDLSSEPF